MKNYRGIDYDVQLVGYQESPRRFEEETKLCIREHSRYDFPNELDYEWDSAGEDAEKLYEEYRVFSIDMYEHGNISFSLGGEGMQCKFDTSSDCGFIAIPKNAYGKTRTEEEAKKFAKTQLEEYTNYCNGKVYEGFVDYPDGEREHFGEYYGDDAEECAEQECESNIDSFLKDKKKFTVQVQYSVEEDLVFYGKDEQDVYEQAQNYELPHGYMENTFDTRAIFDENGTQFFDKDNRF